MSKEFDFGKYIFTQKYDGYKLTQKFDGQTDLHEMIANFESFLRASGFHFDGYLDIVEPDPIEEYVYSPMTESLRNSAD